VVGTLHPYGAACVGNVDGLLHTSLSGLETGKSNRLNRYSPPFRWCGRLNIGHQQTLEGRCLPWGGTGRIIKSAAANDSRSSIVAIRSTLGEAVLNAMLTPCFHH
jgi:hypothetical protein